MSSDSFKFKDETDNVIIRFGKWNNFKSRLIRWITGGEWSHCWVEYNSSHWNSRMMVHSSTKGVMIEPAVTMVNRRGAAKNIVGYKIDTSQSNLNAGFSKSRFYLGKDYGYWAVFINCLLLILSKLKINLSKGKRDVSKYSCSEFVTLFIQNTGIECNLDAEFTWPSKLEDWIKSKPNYFKKVL